MTYESDDKRRATVFPQDDLHLKKLGENIRLAMKRRRITQGLMAERSGLSRLTIRRIGHGNPGVSVGHYLLVLSILGLAGDLAKVAADDELGRKLQDIELLRTRGREKP